MFAFFLPLDELVLVSGKIKDVYAVGARIGHDRPPTGIHCNAVGPHQASGVRLAGNKICHPGPETRLTLDLPLGTETPLIAELPATLQEEIGRGGIRGYFVNLRRRGRSRQQEKNYRNFRNLNHLTRQPAQKKLNHRETLM